jgi:peptidoglycan hydrolase-like protein with peptidoglycan-binding domain
MDKLLFYSLNSKGLPNGPNFNRTGMLGKLTMFKPGGETDPPYIKPAVASTTAVAKPNLNLPFKSTLSEEEKLALEKRISNYAGTTDALADSSDDMLNKEVIIDREPVSNLRSILPYPCYDNTCVEFVKDADKNSMRNSIPSHINNNVDLKEFLTNNPNYRMVPGDSAVAGDIIQFYNEENHPYHAGIVKTDSSYVGSGGGQQYLPFGNPVKEGGLNTYNTLDGDAPGSEWYGAEKDKHITWRYKKVDGGEIVSPGDGWDYQQSGDEVLTKQSNSTDWIVAKGDARNAIENKIFNKPAPNAEPPAEPLAISNTKDNNSVIALQQKLNNAGYSLGNYGAKGDGVDGIYGTKTREAQKAYNAGISPQEYKVKDSKMQNEIVSEEYKAKPQTHSYVNNIQAYLNAKGFTDKNGNALQEDGIMGTNTQYALEQYKSDANTATLPVFPSSNPREETCKNSGDGYGCSKQVSLKEGSLFTPTSMEGAQSNLWANDAWFNRASVEKNGGTVLYETSARGTNMSQLPKDVYGILQVGDYVHLDRKNTPSSRDYASRTSEDGLKNEKVEHMGMIIGKDTDGTPLVWHASETGKAYIKRVDEPITLDDHKSLGAYQISSIARSGSMKDEFQKEVAQNPYYTPIDKDNELTFAEGANPNNHERQLVKSINDNQEAFRGLGYEQEDLNKAGQVLMGIMDRETTRGTNTEWNYNLPSRTAVKQGVATVWKEWLGQVGEGEIAEPSQGLYQIKPELNYYVNAEKGDYTLSNVGKNLKKLGITPDNLQDSEENQNIFASAIMLENMKALKKDKGYNAEKDTWSIEGDNGQVWEYPAAYILTGAWSAGAGWQNRSKYKDMLTSSEGRLYAQKGMAAMDKVTTEKGNAYNQKYTELTEKNNAEERKRVYIEQQKRNVAIEKKKDEEYKAYVAQQSESGYKNPISKEYYEQINNPKFQIQPFASESTAVNNLYIPPSPLPDYSEMALGTLNAGALGNLPKNN